MVCTTFVDCWWLRFRVGGLTPVAAVWLGGELKVINNDLNHYKFTGKESDGETGLDYSGTRFLLELDRHILDAALGSPSSSRHVR